MKITEVYIQYSIPELSTISVGIAGGPVTKIFSFDNKKVNFSTSEIIGLTKKKL